MDSSGPSERWALSGILSKVRFEFKVRKVVGIEMFDLSLLGLRKNAAR